MKAIIKATDEAGSLRVTDMPKPKPGPGQILVQIKATGICYTDVSILNNLFYALSQTIINLLLIIKVSVLKAEIRVNSLGCLFIQFSGC